MNTAIQISVIVLSTSLAVFGAWVIRDKDFHPMWRKAIGIAMVVAGFYLYRHGLNYLDQLP